MDTTRQKGWIPLSTFAFVEKPPARINFLESLLPYKGQDDNLSIPWAVYGFDSLTAISYSAAHYARARKRVAIQLTIWYRIDGSARTITKLPKTQEECQGFMHSGRISSALRDEVHEGLLDLAAKQRTPRQLEQLKDLEWVQLLMQEPRLVREYLHSQKNLLAIVHPVKQMLDPHYEEAIMMASFKLKRDRIMRVEARHFSDIVVEI